MITTFTKKYLLAVFVGTFFLNLICKVNSAGMENNPSNESIYTTNASPISTSTNSSRSNASEGAMNKSDSTSTEGAPVSSSSKPPISKEGTKIPLNSTTYEKSPTEEGFLLGFTMLIIIAALIAFTCRRKILRLYKRNNNSHGHVKFRNSGRE